MSRPRSSRAASPMASCVPRSLSNVQSTPSKRSARPASAIAARLRLAGEELAEDRVDVGPASDALHGEVPPLLGHTPVGGPELSAAAVAPEKPRLLLADDLDVGEVLADLHQLLVQDGGAARRIAPVVVTVRGLG